MAFKAWRARHIAEMLRKYRPHDPKAQRRARNLEAGARLRAKIAQRLAKGEIEPWPELMRSL